MATEEGKITNNSITYDLNEQLLRMDNVQGSGGKMRVTIDPQKVNR